MSDLETVVQLSHEFGGPEYVMGGGGNTSVKNGTTLWVKPSGTTLAGLTADKLVRLDRAAINALYGLTPPAEASAREELVRDLMAEAVENTAGRPSVEAPLHNVFDSRFVVHTHPALVNGMTCAQRGEEACRRLFPEALWIEYIDPGYTLCMAVRERIAQYRSAHGYEPALLFLQNHGIFIAADSAGDIRTRYDRVMHALTEEYTRARIPLQLAVSDVPRDLESERAIRLLFGDDAAYMVSCGLFAYTIGPVTPDHMVYSRAYPYAKALSPANADAYRQQRGYAPKVIVVDDRAYGIGTSQPNAELALALARDGALVMQLAEAFGGIRYMTDREREFIENWEVESYRASQVG